MIKIGTLKRLKINYLGNKAGSIGVCFDRHQGINQNLVSFIFPNGEYDVFSTTDEISHFFDEWEKFENSLNSYKFKNREKLLEDYDSGKFNLGFNK